MQLDNIYHIIKINKLCLKRNHHSFDFYLTFQTIGQIIIHLINIHNLEGIGTLPEAERL